MLYLGKGWIKADSVHFRYVACSVKGLGECFLKRNYVSQSFTEISEKWSCNEWFLGEEWHYDLGMCCSDAGFTSGLECKGVLNETCLTFELSVI